MSTNIEEELRQIKMMLRALLDGKPIASPSEMDGQYGNLKIGFDPKQWRGPSYKGMTASECEPAFLECLAAFFQWAGEKAEAEGTEYRGKPEAPMKFKNAALCRGWALRHRLNGWKAPPVATPPSFDSPSPFGEDDAFGDEGIDATPLDDVVDAIPFG